MNVGPYEWRIAGALLLALVLGLCTSVRAEGPPMRPRAQASTLLFRLVGGHTAAPARPDANPHGEISIACERCHTAQGWDTLRDPLDFDHDRDTPFVLTGRHEQAACRSCHVGLRFDGPDLTADACASCHLDVHRGQLGTNCQQCHTTEDFGQLRGVEIHAQTAFPLTGAHLQVSCESCHGDDVDGAFRPLDPSCFGCHADDYHATAAGPVDHAVAGFPTTCETCHNTVSFSGGEAFDHAAASGGFELLGAHATAPCSACHNPADLTPLFEATDESECFACHEADYEATATDALVDHAAAGFSTNCQECHSVETWEGATFDHERHTGFPLLGAHAALACATCHSGPDFSVPTDPAGLGDCVACHEADHQAAHPSFPTTCADCHTVESFQGATFDHAEVSGGFHLVGAHVALPCTACHTGPDFAPIWDPAGDDDCLTCHAEDHQEAHPSFPTTCTECHSTDSFQGATFDHGQQTGFELLGIHESLDCAACHEGPNFTPIFEPSSEDDCATCHAEDHAEAHPGFPTTCADCHNTTTFAGATFDHGEQTGFPLLGAHVSLECAACHTIPDFGLIHDPDGPDDCVTCHADDHEAAHPSFPTTCAECHTTESFAGATFDHGEQTGFPLVGAHVTLDCSACHTIPDFGLIHDPAGPEDCFACHEADHEQAHPSFPITCGDCHTTESFAGATFDHGEQTGFELVGAHVTLDCSACHTLPDFGLIHTPSGQDDCFACHEADHQAAHPPFPVTCLDCHTTTTFVGGTFDHEQATGFPLVGVHQALACAACHEGPDFTPIYNPDGPDDCFTCHEDEHQAAHPPFPTTCLDCHQPDTWAGATFDHEQATGFPLVGAHVTLDCSACHTLPDFNLIYTPSGPDDCFACHEDDHQAAHTPFPTTCLDCHTTTTFQGGTFNHSQITGFPLVGAHESLDCSACHTIPDFNLINTPSGQDDCFACHEADHQAAHPPFPITCLDCHTTTTFQGATFDHGQATGFPLVGAHSSLDCSACHTLPDFTPIYTPSGPEDCFTCHEDDHEQAHPSFPVTCLDCHTTTTFQGATFDHGQATGFQLVGAHLALDCAACHTIPDFGLLYTPSGQDDCFACHEDDHQAAHPPFPITCLDCHNTTTFQGATFDHGQATGFPLVGAHTSLPCSACHTLPDFGLINDPDGPDDCYACHAEDHEGAHPAFPITCLDCHTTTTFQGATFDHQQATGFPLVGVHNSLPCSACHSIPDFTPLYDPSGPNDCYECHQDEYQQAHPGFPTTCLDCHEPNTWQGATFEHDQYFPIFSGRHEGEWNSCQQCHPQPGNFQVFTCISCHEHRRSEMDDEHEDVQGYVYQSEACFFCHPRGEAD